MLDPSRNKGKTREQARAAEKARRNPTQRAPASDPVNPRSSVGQQEQRNSEASLASQAQRTTSQRASVVRTPESNVPAGQATPLPQPEREAQRQDVITRNSGPRVFRNNPQDLQDLADMESQGLITKDQHDATLAQFASGARGVNPLGFREKGFRDENGKIVFQSGTKEQFTGQPTRGRAPAGAPLQSPEAGASGQRGEVGDFQRFLQRSRQTAQRLTHQSQKTPEQRAIEAGFQDSSVRLIEILQKHGMDGLGANGTFGSNLMLNNVDPAVLEDLRKAGLVSSVVDNDTGGQNVVLNVDARETRSNFNDIASIVKGEDLQALIDQQQQEQLQAVEAASRASFEQGTNRQETQVADDRAQTVSQVNQQTRSSVDNSALNQILAGIPPDLPGGDMIASTLQELFNVRAQNENLITSLSAGRSEALDESYDDIGSMIRRGQNRAKDNYATIDNVLSETLDRQNKLLAQREANDQARLAFEEDKLVRKEKDLLQSNLDTMTASLALRGGFGSDSGLKEIRDAKTEGEQAIIDLQKEFGFKRADISIAYTDAYNKAYTNYQNNTLNAWTQTENRIANLELQGIASEQARASAKDSIFKDMISLISDSRKEYANDLRSAAETVSDVLAQKAKAEADAMVDPEKANEKATKLRQEINGLDIVKEYTDISSKLSGMHSAQQVFKDNPDGGGKGARDIAVLKLYEKILDPDSAVRDGEVQLQLASQGITRGLIQKAIDNFNITGNIGGAGIDERQIQAMLDTADEVVARARDKMVNNLQPQLADIMVFNQRAGTDITLEQIFPPDVIDSFGGYGDEFSAIEQAFGATDLPQESETITPVEYNSIRDWASGVGNGRIVKGSPFHRGVDANAIDIDGDVGDPIPAFSGGRVVSVERKLTGYGTSVVISANGEEHLYAHLDSTDLKVGQDVSGGQVIGLMGNSGNVLAADGSRVDAEARKRGVGSHLHFRASGRTIASNSSEGEVGGGTIITPPAQQPVTDTELSVEGLSLSDIRSGTMGETQIGLFPDLPGHEGGGLQGFLSRTRERGERIKALREEADRRGITVEQLFNELSQSS